jgi:hypothetical protein
VEQHELGVPGWLPSGRRAPKVPSAALEVITAARSVGWLSLAWWGEAVDGMPSLTVRVARGRPRRHFELVWQLGEEHPRCDVSAAQLSLARVRRRKRGQWRPVPNVDCVHSVIASTRHLRVVADRPETPPTKGV